MRHVLLAVLILFASCSSKEPTPLPAVSDYFPLKKGYYQVYTVDSIIVSQNVEVDYAYQLKTEVTDSFPAAGGGFTYVIQRAKRTDPSSLWTAIGTWSARDDAFQLVVNEGNIPYLKLAGPLGNGKSWNGNSYNALGGTEKCLDGNANTCNNYTIGSFGKAYQTAAGMSFQNTLTVIEDDNQDFIVSLDSQSEIYALKAGLIYREITLLNYCTDPDCLGTQFVQSGLKYKQTIIDQGNL